MGIAFSGAATFNNISDQGLQISRVLHKSFIETNEEGTEAAAVTVVELRESASPGPPLPQFVTINRPFIYFIQEKSTGTILFIGKVMNPNL